MSKNEKHYKSGMFIPNHPEKYLGNIKKIVYRSSWELKLMKWADSNPSVLKWASEEIAIPYYSQIQQKRRRYFVDFLVHVKKKDNSLETLLIEIKPYKETIPPVKRKNEKTYIRECITWQINQDKWAAAKKWADSKGFKFTIMTEKELGIK